jgi:hypothetical protein
MPILVALFLKAGFILFYQFALKNQLKLFKILFKKFLIISLILFPLFPFVYRYKEEKMKRSIVILCLLNLLVKILKSDSIDARNDVSQYLAQESDSIRNGIANTALPRGTILMIGSSEIDNWFNLLGVGLGEYRGWFLCDGRNGTPDLRGKFAVGRDVIKFTVELC